MEPAIKLEQGEPGPAAADDARTGSNGDVAQQVIAKFDSVAAKCHIGDYLVKHWQHKKDQLKKARWRASATQLDLARL